MSRPFSEPIVISSDDDDDLEDGGEPAVLLDPYQNEVVELAARGHNIFFTGSAGCGKSTVLHAIKQRLRDMGKQVHVVAPTGMAALAIGGKTIWVYAGWSPHSLKMPLEELQRASAFDRLQGTDVLIIDEISMVENLFFERLSEVMKYVRSYKDNTMADQPFGGVQIIVTGDFCQLPPIKPFETCLCGQKFFRSRQTGEHNCSNEVCTYQRTYHESDKWAFQSAAWADCNFRSIFLTTIYRQRDPRFVQILERCRTGLPLSQPDVDLLMAPRPVSQEATPVSQETTHLFSLCDEVAALNNVHFLKLEGDPRSYRCLDTFSPSAKATQDEKVRYTALNYTCFTRIPGVRPPLGELRHHRLDELLELKIRTPVVLLTNLDFEAGLCNGSQGIIVDFELHDPANLPKRSNGNPRPGQQILTGEHARRKASEIQDFVDQAELFFAHAEEAVPLGWPVVRFPDGQQRTIYPDCQIIEVGDEAPYSVLCRTQIPLTPAWALTVHKAQGMTLDRVVVNLQNVFETGQVYVALSRARTLEGLIVEDHIEHLRTGLRVNEEVQEFLGRVFRGVENEVPRPERGIGTREIAAEAEGGSVREEI